MNIHSGLALKSKKMKKKKPIIWLLAFVFAAVIHLSSLAQGGITIQPGGSNLQYFITPDATGYASDAVIKWYAAASGGSYLPSTTALEDQNKYYTTQTLSCTESADRKAVVVTLQQPVGKDKSNHYIVLKNENKNDKSNLCNNHDAVFNRQYVRPNQRRGH